MKKSTFQLIFCIVYILLSLSVAIWALSGSWKNLLYYTFQGNIFCLVLMMIDLLYIIKGKRITKSIALSEFAGLIAILTIGIIYCTLLDDITTIKFWTNAQSLGFHFFFPILFTVYIFTFRRSEMPPVKKVFWCLIPPVAYIGFVHIRNAVLGIQWYPYFFTDITKIGVDGFLKWVAIIFFSLLIVGSIVLIICRKTSASRESLFE